MQAPSSETERRAEYERVYAEFLATRRTLHGAAVAGAEAVQLRPLRERLRSLRERLASWQRETA